MKQLQALLEQGVTDRVFPLARAEVWLGGEAIFSGGTTPADTVFDVASLTKVMATTPLVLDLHREGLLSIDNPLRRFLPHAAADVTLADLLFHRSGLPAFLPFFAAPMAQHPALFGADCAPSERETVRRELLARVAAVPPEAPARSRAVYSDLGFILLGAVLETVSGQRLDDLFRSRLSRPLGLTAGYRRLSASLPLPTRLADTGASRPREPAPGQEGLWALPERCARRGEVDDDNAWCLDGVSGHAGLFATAADVARAGQAVLERLEREPGGLPLPGLGPADASTPGSTRTLGFDTPSALGASCGPRFGGKGPLGAVGHLGFTGVSLWIDRDRRLVVALLTNRVAHGRANLAIREFRPRFHETVLDELGA